MSSSNSSICMSRVWHDKSTSNLLHHADHCDPTTVMGSSSIKAYSQGSTYNPAKHRMNIALWVARCHHPFSIVQDKELLEIFNDLNNQCVTLLCATVSQDVKEIFKMSHAKVATLLQVSLSVSMLLLGHSNVAGHRLIVANFIYALMAGPRCKL